MKKETPTVAKEFAWCRYEEGCPVEAMCLTLIGGKHVNICRAHYHQHFTGRAKAFCERNNLNTREEMREFIRVRLAEIVRNKFIRQPRQVAERVVGEDDEERAA